MVDSVAHAATKLKEQALNVGAQAAQAVGAQPAVGQVGNQHADQSVTFKGYAALAAGAVVSPWSYHPQRLDQGVGKNGEGAKDFVEIDIEYCGICGSDLHTITAGWGGCTYPQIVGHEIVGKVTAVGSDVKTLKVGDRVGVGAQCWSCGQQTCDACPKNLENICANGAGTYDSFYPNGIQTHGGYAEKTRVCERFAFKIPDAIPPEVAGPLMCAGTTVFAPLKRCNVGPGTKVGVIGIGGLGHLAIQFAAALGADVSAISTSTRKKDDALKMGAKHFVVSKDENQVKEAKRKFEVIVNTANGQDNDWSNWMSMLAPRGKFVNVGLPDGMKIPLDIKAIGGVEGEYVASMIAGPAVIREMLEFAAEKKVFPWIEVLPMSEANKGLEKIRTGDVHYRVVLSNVSK